ncbi:MAG: 50S ribosomal protein L22 [Candidatus Yonathbacteria bacterium]|nr:50S ribosomal protein L22 [Candidatus Yonathbacteria bacterium]
MITATLKTYRQSPRKVRLATDLIKGKSVLMALAQLKFLPKRASLSIEKLLNSAIANAEHNFGATRADLMVKDIRVDKGIVFRRSMPRARGSASPIRKRTSHIVIVLGKLEEKKGKNKNVKAVTAEKTEKKIVEKKTAKKSVK